jgi:hypothetical protein
MIGPMTKRNCGHPAPVIPGAEAVSEWFGGWPCFHDGEVTSLALSRKGESILRVYPYYPDNPATVEFVLSEIDNLELVGFSHQNVISDLTVTQITGEQGGSLLRLELQPCFGLAGCLDAKQIRVNLLPGKSTDGVSQW